MAAEPMRFVIGVEDFDLDLVPADARDVGSDKFKQAVTAYYEQEFADLGGTVDVTFEPDAIAVAWAPPGSDRPLLEQALRSLRRGDLPNAVPLLQALTAVEPRNMEAHYNLGMALSDLGRLDEAKLHLLKVVHNDPENINALVALGVALYRSGDAAGARRRLEQALAQDPENGYAHRNLAAVVGNLGESRAAIEHLREAHRLLPEDQQSTFGLAHALDQFGGLEQQQEADGLYRAAVALDPDSDIAEMARQARSRIAQQNLRSTGAGPRMDAVMYCLGALQKFRDMPPVEVRAVAMEIALLGRQGLQVNNPDVQYTLRSLPGQFTGLHLMSLMYVAFQQFAPDTDIGFDLSQEYQAALQMFEMETR